MVVFMLSGLGTMILQQHAVELLAHIPNAVTCVKRIVLMHVGNAALAGPVLPRERIPALLLHTSFLALGAGAGLAPVLAIR